MAMKVNPPTADSVNITVAFVIKKQRSFSMGNSNRGLHVFLWRNGMPDYLPVSF
jgi:hypothetical protein